MEIKVMAVCTKGRNGETEGSVEKCFKCECDIWASDTTISGVLKDQKELNITRADINFCCIDCAMPYIKKAKMMNPTGDQIKEVLKHVGKDGAIDKGSDFDYNNIKTGI